VEKCVCLSHDVWVADVTWRVGTRIKVGIGDLVWRIGGDQTQVGYSMAIRSGCQVMPCTMCMVHAEESKCHDSRAHGHEWHGP
jgi:hypothetical protein